MPPAPPRRECVPESEGAKARLQAPAEMRPPALVARAIRKQYGGVQALDGADISIGQAEVHALLGENGAGKSTLVKVIAGLVRPDSGEVLVDGRPLVLESPNASRAAGIAVVYQELSLVPQLSVMHNIVLSDLPLRRGLFAPDRAMAIARESLERLGVTGYQRQGSRLEPPARPSADGRDREGDEARASDPHPRRGNVVARGCRGAAALRARPRAARRMERRSS